MTNAACELIPLLKRLSRSFRLLVDFRLFAIGLMSGQDQLLDALPDYGSMSITSLGKKLNVRVSTVSKTADILQTQGLVYRNVDPFDGRRSMISLTIQGRAKRSEVHEVWASLEANLMGSLDQNKISALVCLEAQITKSMSRLR